MYVLLLYVYIYIYIYVYTYIYIYIYIALRAAAPPGLLAFAALALGLRGQEARPEAQISEAHDSQ